MTDPSVTTAPAKKSGFKKFMVRFIIIVLLISSFLVYWYHFNVYSYGERTGLLIKLSKRGNLFKTHEGEMLIGNFQQAPNVMIPEKFYFSVNADALADTLMRVQGKQVSLKYHQYRRTLPWRGESAYIVDGLIKVDK